VLHELSCSNYHIFCISSKHTIAKGKNEARNSKTATVSIMITIVYGSILRPSSNNWASYRRLKWQIAALFL
jgi:hypothetical protein